MFTPPPSPRLISSFRKCLGLIRDERQKYIIVVVVVVINIIKRKRLVKFLRLVVLHQLKSAPSGVFALGHLKKIRLEAHWFPTILRRQEH